MANYNKGPRFPTYIGDDGTIEYVHFNNAARPAIIERYGYMRYINQFGQTHRDNGPAIIWRDGTGQHWVNGNSVSPDEFFFRYGVV